jgi:hypothetical protein
MCDSCFFLYLHERLCHGAEDQRVRGGGGGGGLRVKLKQLVEVDGAAALDGGVFELAELGLRRTTVRDVQGKQRQQWDGRAAEDNDGDGGYLGGVDSDGAQNLRKRWAGKGCTRQEVGKEELVGWTRGTRDRSGRQLLPGRCHRG